MIMLKINRKSNNLLFVEMTIALLFFVISFAVIIRVFASADTLERKAQRRAGAALCAQSIAEAYSVTGNTAETLRLVFGEDIPQGTVMLDSGFSPSEQGEISLALSEERSEAGAGIYAQLVIRFVYEGEDIYSLECGAYIPEGGAAVE